MPRSSAPSGLTGENKVAQASDDDARSLRPRVSTGRGDGAPAETIPDPAAARAHGGAKGSRVEFGRSFKLRNGEAAQVGEGLVIRFERVSKDGRCPVGDPCTSGLGDAVLSVTVQQSPNDRVAFELHSGARAKRQVQYPRFRVRLVKLEPRPVGEQRVPLSQYWATFVVSK